ncbi:hypothetical protein B0H11DRAFT_2280179 [Mycena galericulata]|nr:hypothetical protein B0H11DRAFT_2280179 [Mycena galericulata]
MATIDIDSDSDIVPVDQMIQEVVREHPTAAKKFLVTNPAIVANQLRKDEEKKGKKKRKQLAEDEHEASGSRTKKPKARKSKPANDDEDEDDDDDKNVPFTIYVDITKPPLPTSNRKPVRKPAGGKDDDFVQRGPFKLNTKHSYSYFLSKLAEVLPCHVDNIHQSKIKWKSQKPANGKLLPIGGAAGYEAIQDAMREKTKERVILINMPAPAAPMDEPTAWDTGVEEKPAPAFDYSELEREDSMNSFQQQRTTFNDAIKTEKEKLEAEYPIGNNPLFPELRVYYDPKTKYYFDLTPTRMGVWASHMSQGKTDEKTAPAYTTPASRLFDANQRIKNVPGEAPGLAFPVAAIAAPAPLAVPAPPTPAPALSLSDLLLASLLGQQGGGLGALFPHLNTGAAPLPARRSAPTSPAKRIPSPVKHHNVTAEEFCMRYNIDDTDCTRLKDVGFRPGNHTDSKLEDFLKDAGFTFFGWKRIHQANTQFKADLAGGLFDA